MDRDSLFLTVCLAVFFAPFSGIEIFAFFSVSDIFIVIGLLLLGTRVCRDGSIRFPASTALVLVAGGLFLVVQILGIPRATLPAQAVQWTRTFAGVLVLFVLIVTAVDSRRDVIVLLRTLTISVVVVSLLTIFHSLGVVALGTTYIESRSVFGVQIPFRRTLGVPMDYGNFGLYVSLGVSCLFYEMLEYGNDWALATLPIPLLATLISQSRSTWAAIGVVLATFVVFRLEHHRSRSLGRLPEGPFWGAMGALFLGAGLVMGRILVRINPHTLETRLFAIRHALDIVSRAPFLGIGRYTYFHEYGREIVHNGFVNILVAHGSVGFLLFAVVYLSTAVVLVRGRRNETRSALSVALLAAFLGMTVELMFFDGSYTKVLWILIALIHLLPATASVTVVQRGEGVNHYDRRY